MNDNGDWERRDIPPAPGTERHQRDSLDRNYRYQGPDRNNPAPAKTDTVPQAAEPKTTASRPFIGFLFNTPVAYS